ncbi:MAG: hypothetical protein E6471_11295, partial [Bradyrhizobium sp.]|nr:hypothetical protein [Bradyrhizobium sp.]
AQSAPLAKLGTQFIVSFAARPDRLASNPLLVCHILVEKRIRAIPDRPAAVCCSAAENLSLLHHVTTKARELRFLAREPIKRSLIDPARRS